ncbi:MAG: HesA/MoeB/ThiF family protein [Desulfobacterales bacterium]|nr:HesA/MoeB/ThiF family protein [Desulfobacterales bacterium]
MENGLVSEIRSNAIPKQFRDNTPYISLSVEAVALLAGKYNISGHRVEIEALQAGIVPERYARNLRTFSLQDQAVLLQSRVSVVGLGGLGGGVTEILARIGVGNLNLMDGDTFEDSNLNRQFMSTQEGLATPKVDAAADRVQSVNASVVVEAHIEFLDADNAAGLLAGSDVVVDCLDSLKFRFILEEACKTAGIPLVSAAIAGVAGHVTTIFPEDPGLKLIYGKRDRIPEKGAEASLGTLPQCVTILSALETSEVVKVLLKRGSLLRNRLLVVDLMDNTMEVLKLR